MKPILFRMALVDQILKGRKRQTRRVIKYQPQKAIWDKPYFDNDEGLAVWRNKINPSSALNTWKCPYGKAGDRLWVRETHYLYGRWQKNGLSKTGRQKWKFKALGKEVKYFDCSPNNIATKKNETGWFKRPSIFMPRWAFRITLEIKNIRVERVQEITEIDAALEGVPALNDKPYTHFPSCVLGFKNVWDQINKKRNYPWLSNPWVWVLEFKQIKEA